MSIQPNDGGPAFPHFNPDTEVTHAGMSLRDWFAGQALAGLLASGIAAQLRQTFDEVAEAAYNNADAMLAARNNQPVK